MHINDNVYTCSSSALDFVVPFGYHFGSSWLHYGSLGLPLGSIGGPLGVPWDPFGLPWAPLGLPWPPLGVSLGTIWGPFGLRFCRCSRDVFRIPRNADIENISAGTVYKPRSYFQHIEKNSWGSFSQRSVNCRHITIGYKGHYKYWKRLIYRYKLDAWK